MYGGQEALPDHHKFAADLGNCAIWNGGKLNSYGRQPASALAWPSAKTTHHDLRRSPAPNMRPAGLRRGSQQDGFLSGAERKQGARDLLQ
jgi:hypothetical protein